MTEDRPSLDEIIKVWNGKSSIKKYPRSHSGRPYWAIPFETQKECLMNLYQTLLDFGYSKQQIQDPLVEGKILEECWPKEIKAYVDWKKSRDILKKNWKKTFTVFSDVKISQYKEPKNQPVVPVISSNETIPENEKKEILEDIFNPKGRLKVECFDRVIPELDRELFEKLAAVDKMLKEKKK